MNDYERVARIIRYVDENHLTQPDLAELAACSGLSRYRFHRLFSRWAGVTPKDFLQCLTLADARERLRLGESVLDTAYAAGLSSPGGLHDLCVTLEAVTPGAIKSGGEGWKIEIGFTESPFGICCLGSGPRGMCHLAFVETADRRAAAAPLVEAWPRRAIALGQRTGQRPRRANLPPCRRRPRRRQPASLCSRDPVSTPRLARVASRASGRADQLRTARRRSRTANRCPRCWHGGRQQPGGLSDSLSSGHPRNRRRGSIPLGARAQAGHARLGKRGNRQPGVRLRHRRLHVKPTNEND